MKREEYDPVFMLAHDYGSHNYGCEMLRGYTFDTCTCGFAKAVEEAMEYVASLFRELEA